MPIPLLEGITVVEIARTVAPAYAGRLLADLGAEVIALSIESDGDDGRPTLLAAYLATNKLRAALDLRAPGVLTRIRERADIILYDGSLANDTELTDPVSSRRQRCVVTVVTPFGRQSPYSHLHDDELLYFALSGVASTTPEDAENRVYERPMAPYGHQGAFLGGICAATASLQAWISAQASGRGSVLDVAVADAVAAMPITSQATTFGGHTPSTIPPRPRSMPWGSLRCADGHIYLMGRDWGAFARALDRPDWLEGTLGDPEYRLAHPDKVRAIVERRLADMTSDEASRRCQSEAVIAFPINSVAQVVEHPQIKARQVFQPIACPGGETLMAPRTPIRLMEGRGPGRSRDVLRSPGADTAYARNRLLAGTPIVRAVGGARRLPLVGVRVADFSWVLAGPQCTKWLGALGAEVIKVESRHRPDSYRFNAPFMDNDPTSLEGSVSWNMLNYSKQDCAIHIGTAEGQALAQQLVSVSDVMIENYSTGAAERMGLGYDKLVERNPRLIMVSASGVGRTGPDAGMRAFGKAIHAFSGHTYLAAWPGTPPRGIGGTWTDPTTGMTAALATFAGLIYSRRTNGPLHFDLSMAECTIALMADAFIEHFRGDVPAPRGNRGQCWAPHNSYACADGWLAISCHSDGEWQALASLIGAGRQRRSMTLRERLDHVEELDRAIDDWCAGRTREAALASLVSAAVCATPVLSFDEILTDAHFQSRGLLVRFVKDGVGAYHAFKLPWASDPPINARYVVAPRLGQETEHVCETILGLSTVEITRLRQTGVLD